MRETAVPLLRVLTLLLLAASAAAQTTTSSPPTSTTSPTPTVSSPTATSASTSTRGTGTSASSGGGSVLPTGSTPPDVLLRVPELHVGRIELDVDDLRADLNLNAQIASLVTLNAGVQVGVSKVNITIADVDAQLDLIVRLGHVAEIVNRTLHTLDLNPLLVNLLDEVGDVLDRVVGAVDGLLGSIVQGDTKLSFLIDNLGNIVQEVVEGTGEAVSTIVGNYKKNMTDTGASKDLGNGLTQKTYRYDALGTLVNIVFNTLGQVVQAFVVGKGNPGGGSSTSAVPTTTRRSSSTSATQTPTTTTTTTAA